MFTSHYGNLAGIKAPLQPVSISRGKPRWMKGGWRCHCQPGTIGINYDALAPTAKALKMDDAGYDKAFASILRGLDPAAVYAELGENAVLLCYEEPNEYCHRRIVAEWLEFHLGILIPELGLDRDETYTMTTKAYEFYTPPEKKLAWIETQLAKVK